MAAIKDEKVSGDALYYVELYKNDDFAHQLPICVFNRKNLRGLDRLVSLSGGHHWIRLACVYGFNIQWCTTAGNIDVVRMNHLHRDKETLHQICICFDDTPDACEMREGRIFCGISQKAALLCEHHLLYAGNAMVRAQLPVGLNAARLIEQNQAKQNADVAETLLRKRNAEGGAEPEAKRARI